MTTSSPVFSDRSDGHLAPSAEYEQIHQMISNKLHQLSQIDEKIADFKAILDDLYLQRQALDRSIQEYRAMTPGMHQLPMEIVQAIFRCCLPPRNAAMRSDEAPLLLGRVCSTWRQIAYMTPQLWSSLHVCLPPICGPSNPNDYIPPHGPVLLKLVQYGDAIEAWLRRASDTPLSISFSTKDHSFSTWAIRDRTSDHILEILVRFCHQWKSITISGACEKLAFETLSASDFPLLETAVLHDEALVAPCSLLHTSSLRSVSLRRFCKLHYTWAHIAHLTLGSWGDQSNSSKIRCAQAMDVLQSCSNLITCTLTLRVELGGLPLDTGRVRLPSLEVLRIILPKTRLDTDNLSRDALTFFSCIEAPKLAHFAFKSIYNTWLSVPFLFLFTQPNVIEAVEYSDLDILDSFTDALTLSPSIRRLSVFITGQRPGSVNDMFIDHDSFLNRLSIRPNHDSHICPCLEEIELELRMVSNLSDQALLEFLLSRTDLAPPGVKRLRRTRVVLQRHRSIDILPNLTHAIERGLQIEVIYRPIEFTVNYLPSSELHLAADPVEWSREFLPRS